MPIYEYQCKNKRCKSITEKFHRPDSIPKQVRCDKCGTMARRILSKSAIQCDSINDVPWLASAKQNLPDNAKFIETRGQHEKYLKENNLACKG